MDKKIRNEFGETEHRRGERRSSCMPAPDPPSPVCREKMDRLREHLETKFISIADALVSRTKEIDAHFNNLNNAQARLDKDRDEFLRKENYNTQHDYLVERVDKQSTKISNIELWRAGIEGRASRSNFIAILAIIISLIFSILHFMKPN